MERPFGFRLGFVWVGTCRWVAWNAGRWGFGVGGANFCGVCVCVCMCVCVHVTRVQEFPYIVKLCRPNPKTQTIVEIVGFFLSKNPNETQTKPKRNPKNPNAETRGGPTAAAAEPPRPEPTYLTEPHMQTSSSVPASLTGRRATSWVS